MSGMLSVSQGLSAVTKQRHARCDGMWIVQINIDFLLAVTVHCPTFWPFSVYPGTYGFFPEVIFSKLPMLNLRVLKLNTSHLSLTVFVCAAVTMVPT